MDNESGVISTFKDALRDAAQRSSQTFKDYPLGSQDRQTLADDIWATCSHFTLVESKAGEHKIQTEYKDKEDRVKRLCEALQNNPQMAALHEKCHRIAWRENGTGRLMTSEYRQIVCRTRWPGTCSNLQKVEPTTIDEFANSFFKKPPDHGLSADCFKKYVRWLIKTITCEERELLVLARKIENGLTIAAPTTLDQLSVLLSESPKAEKSASARKLRK